MYNQGWGRDNVDGSIVIHNLKRGDNITRARVWILAGVELHCRTHTTEYITTLEYTYYKILFFMTKK